MLHLNQTFTPIADDPARMALLDVVARLCFTHKPHRGRLWDQCRSKYPMEMIAGPLSQEDIANSLVRNGFDPAQAGLNQIGTLLRKIANQWGDPGALHDAYVVQTIHKIHIEALPPISNRYLLFAELYEAYAAIATPPPLLECLTVIRRTDTHYGEGQQ